MNIRKLTSVTAFLSFIFLTITSVVLYILPHGRIAYWSDWHLWGLNKDQWDNLHINIGILFLITVTFHTYLNWNALIYYIKNKKGKLRVITKESIIASILIVVLIVGTIIYIPPFSSIIDFSESIKTSAANKYGEPPYGHAELSSLAALCRKLNINLGEAIRQLKASGIRVKNSKESIKEIAKANNLTPKEVYIAMLPKKTMTEKLLPENPYPGLGMLTLKNFCTKYHLDINETLNILSANQIKATEDMMFKDIAKRSKMNPIDIYYVIKDSLK